MDYMALKADEQIERGLRLQAQVYKDGSKVLMPKELTAENGAKALLIGEFKESIMVENPEFCGCKTDLCDYCVSFPDEPERIEQTVDVSWTTIKAIYAMAVEHLSG